MAELLLVCTTADLDARDLVRAVERHAPGGVRVAHAAGLLAPGAGADLVCTEARARGATIVVVAPGGPDLLNHALLSVEAARGAGLAVAAVVIAGPGGVAQRALLSEHARADVVELADPLAPSDAVARWPLERWAAAEPLAPPAGAAPGEIALAPYAAWEPRALPDPRGAGRETIGPALLEIVATEGPMLAARAYALYNRAAGGRKLTSVARAPLSSAAYRLRMAGAIELVGAGETPGQDDDVLRLAGSPPVRVRELGPRTLDEVPLDEVAELMRRLRDCGVAGHADELKRAVLDAYGLVRLTAKADEYLGQALALSGRRGAAVPAALSASPQASR